MVTLHQYLWNLSPLREHKCTREIIQCPLQLRSGNGRSVSQILQIAVISPGSVNLSARAVCRGWASHTCHGWGPFPSLGDLLAVGSFEGLCPPNCLYEGSPQGRAQAEMVLYLARLGPGATRVTSGIEAGRAWSDTGSLPAPRQNLIMLPSPAQSSFVRRGRRWGLTAGSGHHSQEGRAGRPAAWISA